MPSVADPLEIPRLKLKNRFVGLPVGLSGYIDSGNSPTDRMVAMYRRRALGGAALITVEGVYVEPYAVSRPGLMGFYADTQLPQYAVLTDAIHQAGAAAAIQFMNRWHADFPYEMDDLSVQQIEDMFGHYVRAAVRAKACGFDAVNLEVAHGWPLARFASRLTNHRHDRWGDFASVPAEVVRRMRAAVGDTTAIIVRLSIVDDLDGGQGITLQQSLDDLCPAFEAAGADALDLTFGLGPIARAVRDYKATELIYAEPGDKFEYFKAVKERVSIPVIGRSRINDPEVARRAVAEGYVDLVGLARQLLADPDFPRKTLDGRDAEVNRCILCQLCQGVTVAPGKTLHCTVNASLGREIDPPPAKASRPKRVLVVGAGPAGMEAALGLADRGCDVTLIDRATQVGGLLPWLARLPNLRLLDLAYLTERQARLLATSNVNIRLDTELSERLVEDLAPEAIVLATGSHPHDAPTGGGIEVITIARYLDGHKPGHHVVVDGHGEGAELAVSLARGGHQVHLVEATPRLQPPVYDYALKRSQALADFLVESGVITHWSTKVAAVEDGAVLLQRHNGLQSRLQADTLLTAGRRPFRPEVAALHNREVHLVGDCHHPRGLAEALDEARAVVNTLCG